jgi:hypothetical protein
MALLPNNGPPATRVPAYVELHRDVVINADLWTAQPEILSAGYGFEGIIGVPGLFTPADLGLAVAAGAGVNLDYLALDPDPTLRNLTSGASPLAPLLTGYGGQPLFDDAMPIVFSWPLLGSTLSPSDIRITLNTGTVVTPDLVGLNPNFDYDERHVIVVFGELGNRIAPGQDGAIYPVSVQIVNDGTPLMAVGPHGPVSLVGLTAASSNPYVAGPALVGAQLTRFSATGDFAPPALAGQSPNDGASLYGAEAQYRLRLFTSGGFSPDGVSSMLPTEFSRYFRLHATSADGTPITITQTGVDYDLGVGSLRIVGLAELGQPANGTTVTYGPYYQEDHDNYIDVIISGDAAAVARLTGVEIPTSAVPGYSDIYNPGGPGRTPQAGTTYTAPSAAQLIAIDVSLESLGTVSYAAQSLAAYDLADDLPIVFRLYNPALADHFYTDSSREAAVAVLHGYVEEGVPFAAESDHPGLTDVYRFLNPGTGDHFYTIDPAERDALLAAVNSPYAYQYEGVAFSAAAQPLLGTEPIHRFYSPLIGDHLYTPDFAEGIGAHYVYEGIAWYADVFRGVA